MGTRRFSVSIIIPVKENWPFTSSCLKSIHQFTEADAAEIIVVDNGSTPETVSACSALLQELFPRSSKLIEKGRNVNFGPACNAGAHAATGQMLFFLNNDTLCTKGWLAPLLEAFATTPNLGAAGPLLLFPRTGAVQHLGIAFHPDLGAEHIYSHVPGTHALCHDTRPLQAITGAALMIPRSEFLSLGGFHEGYRNGFEDIELCCRITQRGKTLRIVPSSIIEHYGGSTEGRFNEDMHNGQLLRQRCGEILSPDLHSLITRDGFEVRLTSALTVYPALPKNRSSELLSHCQGAQIENILDLLSREIFWEEGYEIAIERLLREKATAEALSVCYTQTLFFPHAKNAAALATLAAKSGQPELAATVDAMRRDLTARETVTSALIDAARHSEAYFQKQDDKRHATLYRNWLTKHGTQTITG